MNQLKLHSISAVAKALGIRKVAVHQLMAEGKLGYIEIGKRRKIPLNELMRFQSESIKFDHIMPKIPVMSKFEINNFLNPTPSRRTSLNGHKILETMLG